MQWLNGGNFFPFFLFVLFAFLIFFPVIVFILDSWSSPQARRLLRLRH